MGIRVQGLGFMRATGDFWCRFMLVRDLLGLISLERCFLHRLGMSPNGGALDTGNMWRVKLSR